MHNINLSALLPLFFGLTNPLKNVEGSGPPSLIRKIMRENLEVIFLASLFFVSVLAIAPVS